MQMKLVTSYGVRITKMNCNNCKEPMEGFVYEWVLDCGNSEYDWGRNPLPLRCPDCGIKDWKHDHVQRWRVTYCENESCKDQEYYYYKDWNTKYDYSRIEFPDRSVDGAKMSRAMDVVFGTSNQLQLVKLGRKMSIKEIDEKMEKCKKLLKKYSHSELWDMLK